MRTKSILALITFVTVGALTLGVASAQDYPTEKGSLGVAGGHPGSDSGDPVPLRTGSELRVTGGGFAPGSEVVLTIESDPVTIAVTTADARGEIDVVVVIPDDIADGDHTVKAAGEAAVGGRLVLELPVEVMLGELPRVDEQSTGGGAGSGTAVLLVGVIVAAGAAGGGWFVLRRRAGARP